MSTADDFLDEIVAERADRNPDFPGLVEAALQERQMLRALAAKRVELGLSQTLVAARMCTSQSAVARIERGESDPKMSTIERYAAALGQRIEWKLVG